MNLCPLLWRALVPLLAAGTLPLVGTLAQAGEPLRWTTRDGGREAALQVPEAGKGGDRTGFTLLAPHQTGILFTNILSYERAEANQNLLNGSGVAAGDMDGDGWCDLYFAHNEGANGLFRNTGQWQFAPASAAVGLGSPLKASTGVIFADVNGDRSLDLLVGMLGGPNACFVNLGQGRFTNVTAAAGLISKAGAHSLALADVDGDGDLDLYVANYGEQSILRSGGQFSIRMVNGRQQVSGRWARRLKLIDGQLMELGEPDALYLNDGKGVFTAVSWTGGAFLDLDGQPLKAEPYDFGLSVMFRDIDGNGAPDIYVCNDFQTPDRIWMNDGKGRFRPLPDHAVRSIAHFSMGVDFADIDRDGHDDFFVGDMLSRRHDLRLTQLGATNPPPAHVGETWDRHQVHRSTLNVNRGDGTYAEIGNFAGVAASDWSWSVAFLDADLDGFEDLLIVNKHAYDTLDQDLREKVPPVSGTTAGVRVGQKLKEFPRLITPNYLFRNRGDRTFEEVGARWGFAATNVSHGIALADLDNDGDLDVAVSTLDHPPLLYRNESTAPRVAVRLRGLAPNTQGIGARIQVLGGAVPIQSQEMQCGGRYLSADDTQRTFAAGSLTNVMTIEVTWRSGRRSVLREARANRLYEIGEAQAQVGSGTQPGTSVARREPVFQDVSDRLNHRHVLMPAIDFERQPLLPRSAHRLGPGVAWQDLDGDGREELIVGNGAGSGVAVFGNDGRGGFKPWPVTNTLLRAGGEVAGLAAWSSAAGQRTLLVAESRSTTAPDAPILSSLAIQPSVSGANADRMVKSTSAAAAPGFPATPGPIAVGDVEGDGDLDVFVGGRVIPGRYPEAAPSLFFRNDQGSLRMDDSMKALLQNVGLVSGAIFTDLTGDGLPELVLACEWGGLHVFRNERGVLTPWDVEVSNAQKSQAAPPRTLRQWTGWWNSVTSGDFDGDGRLDLIAGNWGLNSAYAEPSPDRPLQMFFGDFDGNSAVDLLETEWDESQSRLAPRRDLALLSQGWPALRTRFASHRMFSKVAATDVLGPGHARASFVQAVTLASTVFFNRGERFEAVRLPDVAQYAPAFGISVADFDGDGFEDAFLAQNFFANRPEEPRLDAGRGLLLRGNGAGEFQPMPGLESGIVIHGEQRGSAVADFDEDGRADLVVAQHGTGTRLLRNVSANPGVRVRLKGPSANPDAHGASVWWVNGSQRGPAREIRGGGGYWSQDSPLMVLSQPSKGSALVVRWPGGLTTTNQIPSGASAVTVDAQGRVEAR